jgi:hypothetical protein
MADKAGDANIQKSGDSVEQKNVAAQAESNLHACAYERPAQNTNDATRGIEANVTPEQHMTAAERGINNVLTALTQKDSNGLTLLDRAAAAGELDKFTGLKETLAACQQTFALNDNRDGKGVSDLLKRLDKTMAT